MQGTALHVVAGGLIVIVGVAVAQDGVMNDVVMVVNRVHVVTVVNCIDVVVAVKRRVVPVENATTAEWREDDDRGEHDEKRSKRAHRICPFVAF